MNKRGFTLVEILSVVVLIALLFGLGIPGVKKISDNMKIRAFDTKINLVMKAGELWGQDNKALLQSDDCVIDGSNRKCYKISIEELINQDYLDSENKDLIEYNNPKDNSSLLYSCVYIYKKNNRVYAFYNKELSNSEECKVNNIDFIENIEYDIDIFVNSSIDNPCSFETSEFVFSELIQGKRENEAKESLENYSGEEICKEEFKNKLETELIINDKNDSSRVNLSYNLIDYEILGPFRNSTNSYYRLSFIVEVDGKKIRDELIWQLDDVSSPILLDLSRSISRWKVEDDLFISDYTIYGPESITLDYYIFDNYDGLKKCNVSLNGIEDCGILFNEDLVSEHFGSISYNYISNSLLRDTNNNEKDYKLHYNIIDLLMIQYSSLQDYYILDSVEDDPLLKDLVDALMCSDERNSTPKPCINHAVKIQMSWGDDIERSEYVCTWTKGIGYSEHCGNNSGIAPEYYPYNDEYKYPVSFRIYTDEYHYLSYIKGIVLERRYRTYTDNVGNYEESEYEDSSLFDCDADFYFGDCRPAHCYDPNTGTHDPC